MLGESGPDLWLAVWQARSVPGLGDAGYIACWLALSMASAFICFQARLIWARKAARAGSLADRLQTREITLYFQLWNVCDNIFQT